MIALDVATLLADLDLSPITMGMDGMEAADATDGADSHVTDETDAGAAEGTDAHSADGTDADGSDMQDAMPADGTDAHDASATDGTDATDGGHGHGGMMNSCHGMEMQAAVCTPPFSRLGLDFSTGAPAGAQTAFRVVPK